jgi:Rrf2 family protein
MAANSQFSMAVHILTMLAKAGDENVKSECIAASVNTNPVVIRRILSQLNNAGLVSSQTGAFGGTRLAKQPSEISLCSIYKAVACGEVFALHAKAPNQDCPIGRNIEAVLCNLQKEIDAAVGEKLGQYTLASIIEKVSYATA